MPAVGDPGTATPGDESPRLDETTLWAVVEAAPDGILLVDEHGDVLFANRQVEELFGIARRELVGRSVEELLPDRLRQVHQAHRAGYRAEPRRRPMGVGLVLHGRRADGSEFPVEISLSPLVSDAGPRVVAVVRDVSERLETEQRLQRAEQHLRIVEDRERIARDLHDVVIQKIFAAGMTVQSVASRSADPDQSRRLHRVVDDLDDTIREIRSVIFSLQSELRDHAGLRARILEVIDDERGALGIEPRIHFDGPVDATSESVAGEVVPVVREAISNVARHAGASNVAVEVEHRDGWVRVRVVDDGVGLPAVVSDGRGIANLTARAEKLGGRCRVSAGPRGGTIVEWQVPDRDPG
jgi:PAS domain S-box-containing protein